MRALLSVVVVNYGRPELVGRLISSVSRHPDAKLIREFVVVDNGAPDLPGSEKVVRTAQAPFPCHCVSSPLHSYASGLNRGAYLCSGSAIALVNNDVEWVPHSSVAPLLEAFKRDARIGVAGPQLVFPDGQWQRSAGMLPSLVSGLAALFLIESVVNGFEALRHNMSRDRVAKGRIRSVGYVDGAFMVVRRECLMALGGLDETYDFYGEDVDLCWRAKGRGWRCVTVTASQIMHVRGASSTSVSDEGYLGRMLVAKTNFVARRMGPKWARWYARIEQLAAAQRAFLYALVARIARSRPWSKRAETARQAARAGSALVRDASDLRSAEIVRPLRRGLEDEGFSPRWERVPFPHRLNSTSGAFAPATRHRKREGRTSPYRSLMTVTAVVRGQPDSTRGDPPQGLTTLGLVRVLLAHWRFVSGVTLSGTILAAVLGFVIPPMYTASVTFIPESGTGRNALPAALGGIVGQLGLNLGAQANESPRFYEQVSRSRQLINAVLQTRFAVPPSRSSTTADSARLVDLLGVQAATPARQLFEGARVLSKRVTTEADLETHIVTFRVSMRDPVLAAAVASSLVDELNRFNLQTRQSRARQRRLFVERRLVETAADLEQVEDELKRFLRTNRVWETSSDLKFEHDRLERQLQIRQEVYLTLRRELETARIDEVNDAAVITIIDPPSAPQERSSPRRALIVTTAFLASATIAVLLAFVVDFAREASQSQSSDYREVVRRWDEIKRALRRLKGRS